MTTLKRGSIGADVTRVQQRLNDLGFHAGNPDGVYGADTEAAVLAFQNNKGLPADGAVGPGTAQALGLDTPPDADPPTSIPGVTVEVVCKIFPGTPVINIQRNLPPVLDALLAQQLSDKRMVLMALGTIRAETGSFRPVSEGISRFNSSGSPGGHPFDLYDNRADLGNQGPPDGERFKGRGFVQLTGRVNYLQHGQAIGMSAQLIDDPDLANAPDIAAKLLASFLKSKEGRIRTSLAANDLKAARRLVNGGSHGLDEFTAAYQAGDALLADRTAMTGTGQ